MIWGPKSISPPPGFWARINTVPGLLIVLPELDELILYSVEGQPITDLTGNPSNPGLGRFSERIGAGEFIHVSNNK